jgi:hypothetical protein
MRRRGDAMRGMFDLINIAGRSSSAKASGDDAPGSLRRAPGTWLLARLHSILRSIPSTAPRIFPRARPIPSVVSRQPVRRPG